MCVVVQIARIVVLFALCCSAAFADMGANGPSSLAELNVERRQAHVPPSASSAISAHGRNLSASEEPFGVSATPAPRDDIFVKWHALQSQIDADIEAAAACHAPAGACSQEVRRFLSFVALGRKQGGRAQLGWINRAVNLSIRPMSDWEQYGYADVWASPLQTLRSGAGDCEDYAILKYAILRELGFRSDDLRLVILEDDKLQAEHAIVAVREDGEWLILDNRTMAILSPADTQQYRPLFVLNWQSAQTIKTAAVDPTTDR